MASWTSPRTWVTSETVTAALLNTHLRDNITYLYDLFHTAWASFTPTLGGTSASLGNGSLTCHYTQSGKRVIARYAILGGSTTNLSSDNLTLTLPVTARDPGNFRIPVGNWIVTASGGTTTTGVAMIDHNVDTGNDRIRFLFTDTGASLVTDSTPIAGFSTGDKLTAQITYEAA